MYKAIKIFGLLFFALASFVLYTFWSTGFFRSVKASFAEEVISFISLAGVEDIEVDEAYDFAILSSDDRAARRDGIPTTGGLYFLDLKKDNEPPKKLSHSFESGFNPHGISMMALDSQRYRILAINHVNGRHTIEKFDYEHGSLIHLSTLTDASMVSPNDVVIIDKDQFYFTNDHGTNTTMGRLAEDYLGMTCSNVVFFNGQNYSVVADGIAYANGINVDQERNLLFVASPRKFEVKVYDKETNGDLSFIENIDCGTGVDNIEFDTKGNLWIGCHPSLLHFSAYAAGRESISPSEVIKIDYRHKGDYTVKSMFLDDGSTMSGATVAIPYRGRLIVGNVMDDHIVVLRNK